MALPDGYEHKNAQKCFEQAIKGSICIWAPTVILPAIQAGTGTTADPGGGIDPETLRLRQISGAGSRFIDLS